MTRAGDRAVVALILLEGIPYMSRNQETDEIQSLFDNNRQWAEQIERDDPGIFERLATQQKPKYLWIGCSDSRVPANQITGLMPGEVFVHRNVANLVLQTDLNCMSVVDFAIRKLQVRHVIICGHYGCAGVQAALEDGTVGVVECIEHQGDGGVVHTHCGGRRPCGGRAGGTLRSPPSLRGAR